MQKVVEQLLRRHGTPVEIWRGEQKSEVRCFFQPVNSTSQRSMVHSVVPLGLMCQGEYIYIGPPEPAVQEGDTLILGEVSYLLRRVETYRYRGRKIYHWALCSRKGGEEPWGM